MFSRILSRFLRVPALPDGLVAAWAIGSLSILAALIFTRPERTGENLWKEAVEEFGSAYNLSVLLKGTERLASILVINAVLFFVGQVAGIDVGALQSFSIVYSYAVPTLSVGLAVFLFGGCDLSVSFHSEATLLLESAASLLALSFSCFHLGRRVARDRSWLMYAAYFPIGAPVFRSFLLLDPVNFLEYRFVLERLLRRLSPSNLLEALSSAFSAFSSLWLNFDAGSNPFGRSAWTLQHPSCVKSYRFTFLLVKAAVALPFVALGFAYSAGWRLSHRLLPSLRVGGGGGPGRRLGSGSASASPLASAPSPASASEPAAGAGTAGRGGGGGGGGARRTRSVLLLLSILFGVKGERSGMPEFRVGVGRFPKGENVAPVSLAVFALNGLAVFVSFDGWSADEAINGFMLTTGLGIAEETRSKVAEFEPAIKEFLSKSPPITLDEDSIVAPVVLAGVFRFLKCSRFDDFRHVSREFLSQHGPHFLTGVIEGPENTNATELFAAQLSVRARMLARQHEAFKDFKDDDEGERREQQPTCPSEIFATSSKSTTTSHLLTRHYIENGSFPAFVVNLWWNTPRRAFMQRQLARSGLLSNAYLALGADALSLTQYVLSIGLDKNSREVIPEGYVGSGLAHVQVMQEVMRSNLPFAIVLEDDVELSTDITCTISQALLSPDLPADWHVLYLEYSADLCWSVAEVESGLPQSCVAAVRGAPPNTLVRLEGPCAAGTSRAYVVSSAGSAALLNASFPLRENSDAMLREAIRGGRVNAFFWTSLSLGAARSLATTHQPSKLPGASQTIAHDSLVRYVKFDDDGKTVVHTWNARNDRKHSCFLDPCVLVVDALPPSTTTATVSGQEGDGEGEEVLEI